MSVIIGYKDILLVIAARENVVKRTFVLNSPGACHVLDLSKTKN
jgi:hypothetical protein